MTQVLCAIFKHEAAAHFAGSVSQFQVRRIDSPSEGE